MQESHLFGQSYLNMNFNSSPSQCYTVGSSHERSGDVYMQEKPKKKRMQKWSHKKAQREGTILPKLQAATRRVRLNDQLMERLEELREIQGGPVYAHPVHPQIPKSATSVTCNLNPQNQQLIMGPSAQIEELATCFKTQRKVLDGQLRALLLRNLDQGHKVEETLIFIGKICMFQDLVEKTLAHQLSS